MSVCVYCGKEADTREHIPARNLFSITANVPFITVPSCKTCNSGFQMDEEFFRNFLVSILYEQSQSATILLDNSVARSMRRKPALGLKMFEQMSLVDYYDGFGNYHGKKTAMHIKPAKPKNTSDPTGAGDAFRAGFLAGYLRLIEKKLYGSKLSFELSADELVVCGQMGSVSAVYTVEKYGTQTHQFTLKEFEMRYKDEF
ncbi:MAG: Adenosine kinase [Candidatus Amesbacteria bacterium GW2011_GWC2_47_8]|uniref:Adenosine kinase n=1 Tax=Candidatus Amesbacteria bacterium GW2011_GWC2_47_8 TaxID=1618367 RepID=A0A0G1TMM6_9BACT|nr:MAG: Adenosine kinase [Candidatus Amesbacteria bacterium GW2011_GWC2_47_8]